MRPEELTREQEQFLEDFFQRTLYPIVTPLAIDPGHPFPYLTNRSLSLVVSLRPVVPSPLPYTELSIVHIPGQVVPRFIQLPAKEGQYAFILLEHEPSVGWTGIGSIRGQLVGWPELLP